MCLKDDVAFALLITLSPHKVTMFNELDNFHGLDTILNLKLVGLWNHVSWQHDNNIGESSNRKGNRLEQPSEVVCVIKCNICTL